jgi:hypothetical protein
MSVIIFAYFLWMPFVVDTRGAVADTLCSSCFVILFAVCGVLDVEAAGARCTGRLTPCGILSSSVIAAGIRVLALFIEIADIIVVL